ncbi:YeeE/YedE family protein [Acidiphilium multivorum]|uniref:YeeE/YedE family protein n=1 Tax=Acidiphilium multivorum TaxID=62140 RepID=UPI0039C96E67
MFLLARTLGAAPSIHVAAGLPVMIGAGLLVGIGTALGGGCTSGHGVCGLARVSPRSIVATLIFMAIAVIVVFLTRDLGAV